ncbi:MAG TPA: VanW family protein [Thermomicrobiales bacterium]|nr:VanW family protein [Thermomicrobiales bacterium]
MNAIRRRQGEAFRVTRRTLVVAGIGAAGAIALGASLPARYIDRVYPGTRVLGQDLSGLTVEEAVERVRTATQATTDALVTLRLGEKRWVASAADVGVAIDWDGLAEGIYARGRNGFNDRAGALIPGGNERTVALPVTLNGAVLDQWLAGLGDEIAVEPVDARLDGHGSGIGIIDDVPGRALDVDAARRLIMAAAESLSPRTADVPVIDVTASITTDQLAATRDAVIRLTSQSVTMKAGRDEWEITPEQLTEGLVMPEDTLNGDPWLDPWWMDQLVDPVVNELWEAPKDAVLAWDGGLYALEKSRPGSQVDRERLVELLTQAASSDERTVEIPRVEVAPRIDSDNLDALGISGLIASGDSSFAGSSEARSTNVGVASEWVSQTAIAPGEEFSFNAAIGAITEERGYVTGKIIVGDWFADDLGGGVCQVSTTVYRAALYAGLPFTEWNPHSARVGFYELDGWAIGVDAAIYQIDPSIGWPLDLKFTNTTGSWLLLQMTRTDTQIVASLYGAPTGWHVEIPYPLVGEPIPAPPPVTRTTNELPPGESRVVQQSQTGVNVELQRTVTDADGNVLDARAFKSFYAPLPQIIEIGQAGPSSQPSSGSAG